MENQEKTALDRVLEEQNFKDAEEVIKSGEGDGSLENSKLVKKLIEEYKGRTVQAPIEVIVTSAVLLNAEELVGIIEGLKHIIKEKMAKELKAKIDKGEATTEDAMLALMLAMSNR